MNIDSFEVFCSAHADSMLRCICAERVPLPQEHRRSSAGVGEDLITLSAARRRLKDERRRVEAAHEQIITLKRQFIWKWKILSSFTQTQVSPDLYECVCSEHKGRYSEESV